MAESGETSPEKVVVMVEGGNGITQPQTFVLCPLGVQFYTDHPLREFDLMSFELHPSDETTPPVHCTGAVVRCQQVDAPEGRYRVWLKFLDAPEQTCEQLKCTARKGGHLCSDCENF